MISGVVADAMDRRRVLLLTQRLSALVALALAVLTYRGLTAIWPIYVLAAVGAGVSAFDLPARAGARADAGAARAPVERHHAQYDHVSDRVGRGSRTCRICD